MKRIFLTLLTALICVVSTTTAKELKLLSGGEKQTSKWIVEQTEETTITLLDEGSMEIVNPGGLTMWYDKKFKGDYQISYSVKFVMEGGEHDRLSDLNCFWGAEDPQYPKNLYKRSELRGGEFTSYNYLNLFYVGYGGNRNRTTRFRRYFAEFADDSRETNRPVIKEYTDAEDLLKANQWLNIVITVKGGRTTYSMDGKLLFDQPLEEGQDEGYFGLRLLRNHTIVKNFAVKEYTKADTYKYDEVIVEQEATDIITDKWGDDFKYVEYPKQYLDYVVEVVPGESIQAAIDAVNAQGGGVVKLLAGTHVVNKTIAIKSGVTLIGEGTDKTTIEEGEGIEKQCLEIDVHSQVTDVVMKDFTLKGNDIGSVQGIFISGVDGARHQRMLFQNLVVEGWGSHGVHIKRTDHMVMDRCVFTQNGSRNGLYHNLYFLFNKNLLQSDCNFSNPVLGKGCKYTSCEFVLAQRCTIENCLGNGVQSDNEFTGYLLLHKYRISGCGQVALWFPCEYYFGKFDYTDDPRYAPQNIILSRCEIVDNRWGAMWRVVQGRSYVLNSHFKNTKIDMGLLLCNVEIPEGSTFETGNRLMDDLKQWPMDVHLLW